MSMKSLPNKQLLRVLSKKMFLQAANFTRILTRPATLSKRDSNTSVSLCTYFGKYLQMIALNTSRGAIELLLKYVAF